MYAMNPSFNAPDPSAQVPPQLLPHVHLVSSYRFPTLPSLQPSHALEYLVKAPSIVKDASPVAWNFFQTPPPDGTVLLTWQPPRLGTHYASDGLVWADPEVAYDMNIRGYQIQVFVHKSGYHYPHEPYATHARYRYRVTNGPGAFDPNLWIVHYTMAEQSLRIPAGQIMINRDVHQQLSMRSQLQSTGQLIRKEFMFYDSSNWPKVEFAQGTPRGQAFYNPMQQRAQPYAPQQPPAKRQRLPNQQPARQPVAGAMPPDTFLDEEENATQDSFDFMTPREISLSRYKQHHEWMEEIFSSPHAIGEIAPIDLGLGLMGELAFITKDILDAPAGDAPIDSTGEINFDYGKKVKEYHRLEPAQLKDLESRLLGYEKDATAELEKMKAAHAKKLADLKKSRTYIKAERRLRDAPRLASTGSGDDDTADPLNAVVADLEKSLGVQFDTKKLVVCVDKGGFMEAQQPDKTQVNGNGLTPSNLNGGQDGDNTAASLLDQFGTGSLTGTPGANLSIPAMSQPQSQAQSAVATPSAPAGEATHGTSFDEQAASLDPTGGADDLLNLDVDVEMSGMTNADSKVGEDWVMVNEQAPANAQQSGANAAQPATSNDAGNTNTLATSGIEAEAGGIFDTADFGSFDNLDTAGDALADYTNVDDDNMGLDLVDDSAFGDAFQGIGEGGQ